MIAHRTRRTTPNWAVVVLMAVVALAVVASIPASRALRAAHEETAVIYRLTDLIRRQRDASWGAITMRAQGASLPAGPAIDHVERDADIRRLLLQSGGVLPDGLTDRIAGFQALIDQQLGASAPDLSLPQRVIAFEQVRETYAALVRDLDRAARIAAAEGDAAEAWESIVLFGTALAAMTVVILLFVVLQRRNADLEYTAGRRAALEGEQRRLRALIAASSDLVTVLDENGRITWASPSVTALLEREERPVIGMDPSGLLHPDDLVPMRDAVSSVRTGTAAGPLRVECRVRLGPDDADERWMEMIVTDGTQEPGIDGMIVTGRDITEQRRASSVLEARERELRELMEHVNGIFYRAELGGGPWTFVSPQLTRVLGWTPEEWTADPGLWVRSIHPDDRERVLREEQEPTSGAIDYRMLTRSGEVRWMRDDASPVQPPGRSAPYWAGTLTDVTRAYQVEEDLRYQAHHDALTGLPNRSLLLDRLGNALDRSRRKPSDVGVVFIDLDDFKTVNDELGHAAGDALLVAVAERLRAAVRPGDTAARLGGDEFALLVDEVDRDALSEVADRAMEALEAPLTIGARQLHVAASVGVAISRGVGTDPERLLREADTAMYVAKRQGKRRWVFFDPGMSGPQRQRVRMESDLRRALANDEFQLVYQPVVRLADGLIEGVEALLRWHSPEVGTIDPAGFLDVAEESGLLVPIGRWVLRRACLDAAMWQRYARRGIWLGVNISARQLLDPGMVGSVNEALTNAGLAPGQLVLEMTERAALRDIDTAETRLAELHDAGVRLAIDDFGSGTSSIGHLRRLDFDIIKIDRSLVADVHRSPDAQALVRSIVHISRTLRSQPLAEGIEDAEQLQALRAAGCELGQGYLFARPMDALLLRNAFLPRNLGAHAG